MTNDILVVDSMRREGVPAKILDEEGVLEKFGVPPSKIIDYLTLLGDAVDNIPGVPKVGPKTAKKWLEEYGNLDEVIKNAEFIKGAVGKISGNLLTGFRKEKLDHNQERCRCWGSRSRNREIL